MYFLLDGRGVQFSYIYEIHDIYGIFNDERILGYCCCCWVAAIKYIHRKLKKKGRNFEYFLVVLMVRNVYT